MSNQKRLGWLYIALAVVVVVSVSVTAAELGTFVVVSNLSIVGVGTIFLTVVGFVAGTVFSFAGVWKVYQSKKETSKQRLGIKAKDVTPLSVNLDPADVQKIVQQLTKVVEEAKGASE